MHPDWRSSLLGLLVAAVATGCAQPGARAPVGRPAPRPTVQDTPPQQVNRASAKEREARQAERCDTSGKSEKRRGEKTGDAAVDASIDQCEARREAAKEERARQGQERAEAAKREEAAIKSPDGKDIRWPCDSEYRPAVREAEKEPGAMGFLVTTRNQLMSIRHPKERKEITPEVFIKNTLEWVDLRSNWSPAKESFAKCVLEAIQPFDQRQNVKAYLLLSESGASHPKKNPAAAQELGRLAQVGNQYAAMQLANELLRSPSTAEKRSAAADHLATAIRSDRIVSDHTKPKLKVFPTVSQDTYRLLMETLTSLPPKLRNANREREALDLTYMSLSPAMRREMAEKIPSAADIVARYEAEMEKKRKKVVTEGEQALSKLKWNECYQKAWGRPPSDYEWSKRPVLHQGVAEMECGKRP